MNEEFRQLHDRATRGFSLTEQEQAKLEAYYAASDKAEGELLSRGEPIKNLQAQIAETLEQITTTAHRIQLLSEQNEALRREIRTLNV